MHETWRPCLFGVCLIPFAPAAVVALISLVEKDLRKRQDLNSCSPGQVWVHPSRGELSPALHGEMAQELEVWP